MIISIEDFDISAIIYTIKDFSQSKYELQYTVDKNCYVINFDSQTDEKFFVKLLNDYVLRIKIASEVKPIKQAIIQTALFDLIEDE